MARQSRGMACHTVSSARRRPRPGQGAESLRSQAGGAGNAGLGGGSRTRRGGRPWAEPPAAQAQWGHVALPVPAGSCGRALCPPGAAPRAPDSPVSGPRRTVHGLACHVTDSRHPPEVACVIAAKIPGVENVTFLTAQGWCGLLESIGWDRRDQAPLLGFSEDYLRRPMSSATAGGPADAVCQV